MPSFQAQIVVNYIKRLTPAQRRGELESLLAAFPDDWLNDAIAIALAIRKKRGPQAAPPDSLGRVVP